MREPVEVAVDVTDQVALGIPAHTAATIVLPEPDELADPPVVCFAFPGGGYSRRYYTFDMPGDDGTGQAGWHARRGWIFVACDHLGFGDSTVPDGNVLNYDNVALGNKVTVEQVMARLEKHASTALPGNVATEVRGWCGWVRRVSATPATLLRCPDADAAARVMGALGKHAERVGDTIVAVALDGLTSALRQKLQGQGVLVEGSKRRKK